MLHCCLCPATAPALLGALDASQQGRLRPEKKLGRLDPELVHARKQAAQALLKPYLKQVDLVRVSVSFIPRGRNDPESFTIDTDSTVDELMLSGTSPEAVVVRMHSSCSCSCSCSCSFSCSCSAAPSYPLSSVLPLLLGPSFLLPATAPAVQKASCCFVLFVALVRALCAMHMRQQHSATVACMVVRARPIDTGPHNVHTCCWPCAWICLLGARRVCFRRLLGGLR